MQEQARGPLALGDDVIRAETGRDSESWYIMLDAGGAQAYPAGRCALARPASGSSRS